MSKTIKGVLLVAVIALAFSSVRAQTDEINRAEVFAGYSYLSVDSTLSDDDFDDFDDIEDRVGLHGVNLSVTGNFSKYVGAKFDFSTNTKREEFSDAFGTGNVRYRVNQFMGGVQVKNNAKEGPRFKPFGHILAGVAQQRITFDDDFGFDDDAFNTTNFAMAFGGGVDVKVHRRVDIRVFQVDYNPIFFREQDFGDDGIIPGRTQNNVRFSFGVVFH